MSVEYTEKKLREMTPEGLSLTEFITYISIVCSAVFFLTKFHAFKFDQKLVDTLSNIWNFNVVFFLFIIVIIFVFIDLVQWNIKFKYDLKYDVVNWRIMTERFTSLFTLFVSIYVLEVVLFNIDGKVVEKLSNWQENFMVFYVVWLFIYFVKLTMEMFKERDYGEFEAKIDKLNYLKKTINKFEKSSDDAIRKRILLCQLYEYSSKLYDDNIKLDEDFFRREEQLKSQAFQNEERSRRIQKEIDKINDKFDLD